VKIPRSFGGPGEKKIYTKESNVMRGVGILLMCLQKGMAKESERVQSLQARLLYKQQKTVWVENGIKLTILSGEKKSRRQGKKR